MPHPIACKPQAWATCAPALFVRTMLGLDARDGKLTLDPCIPTEVGRIQMTGTNAFGKKWDVEATGTQSHIRLAP